MEFKVQFVPWPKILVLVKKLIKKIKSSGFRPDAIVAIARGGFVPARLLADAFLIKNLISFRIQRYGGVAKPEKTAIKFPIAEKLLRGKKVLLVDDITDSGTTLSLGYNYVGRLKPAELKTAVLQHKITSNFIPDFAAEILKKWRWITYPWARHEDIVDLTAKLGKRLEPSKAKAEIKKRFGLAISKEEAVAALEELKKAQS